MAGIIGQGNIVKNGLILNLDAANPRSYTPPYDGVLWRDLSGQGNNGTLVNNPTFNSSNGGCIVFDGVNDHVNTISSLYGSNTDSYTFSSWFIPLTTASQVLNRGRDGAGGWSLLLGSQLSAGISKYRVGVVTTIPSVVGTIVLSDINVTLNQWVSITGVWKPSNSIEMYINGVFEKSSIVTGSVLRSSTEGWVLGRIASTAYSNNITSNVLVYNRALSSSEILQNFNATRGRYGI